MKVLMRSCSLVVAPQLWSQGPWASRATLQPILRVKMAVALAARSIALSWCHCNAAGPCVNQCREGLSWWRQGDCFRPNATIECPNIPFLPSFNESCLTLRTFPSAKLRCGSPTPSHITANQPRFLHFPHFPVHIFPIFCVCAPWNLLRPLFFSGWERPSAFSTIFPISGSNRWFWKSDRLGLSSPALGDWFAPPTEAQKNKSCMVHVQGIHWYPWVVWSVSLCSCTSCDGDVNEGIPTSESHWNVWRSWLLMTLVPCVIPHVHAAHPQSDNLTIPITLLLIAFPLLPWDGRSKDPVHNPINYLSLKAIAVEASVENGGLYRVFVSRLF